MDRSPPPDDPRLSWLLVTVSTAGASSTLRVYAWRKLRSLGAVYLHKSVAFLPQREETSRAVNRLADRVRHEGGQATVWAIEFSDPAHEDALVALFQAERSDEYGEICARTPAFHAEIAQERARGRTTYAEVEESEADLDRLRTWLGRVRARDYFDAPGGDEATAAVAACVDALAAFEAEALRAEAPDLDPQEPPAARGRLRSLPPGSAG